MVKLDNPAGRLHSVLVKMKGSPRNTPMSKAWFAALEIEDKQTTRLYLALSLLYNSLLEIEREIALQDVDAETYLQHIPDLKQLLSAGLHQPIEQCEKFMSEGVLMSLQFCSERMSRFTPERIVDKAELTSLQSELLDLAETISSSTFELDLKTTLLDLIESMRRALAEYNIRGASGLRDELFQILSRLQRNLPALDRERNSPLVEGFWQLLTRYDTLTSICINVPPVIAGFEKLLSLTH